MIDLCNLREFDTLVLNSGIIEKPVSHVRELTVAFIKTTKDTPIVEQAGFITHCHRGNTHFRELGGILVRKFKKRLR